MPCEEIGRLTSLSVADPRFLDWGFIYILTDFKNAALG